MPIDLPDSPVDGQVETVGGRTWTYDASLPGWKGGLRTTYNNPTKTTLTGDGTTVSWPILGAADLTNAAALSVDIDGISQEPGVDFTVNNGTLTTTSAVPLGAKIVVVSPTHSLAVGQAVLDNGHITGATTFGAGAGIALWNAMIASGGTATCQSGLGGKAVGIAVFEAETKTNALSTLGENFYIAANDSATRNNDALADDETLYGITLDANSVYEITALVAMSSTATSGFKWLLALSGAANTQVTTYYGINSSSANLAQISLTASTGLTTTSLRAAAHTIYIYSVRIEIQTSAAVTLALRWAQNTTDAAQTATRKGGSWIRTKKLN